MDLGVEISLELKLDREEFFELYVFYEAWCFHKRLTTFNQILLLPVNY